MIKALKRRNENLDNKCEAKKIKKGARAAPTPIFSRGRSKSIIILLRLIRKKLREYPFSSNLYQLLSLIFHI